MGAVTKKQCDWGEKVGTDEDNRRCTQVAVGIVAVKDGGRVHALAVCPSHRLYLVAETAPL